MSEVKKELVDNEVDVQTGNAGAVTEIKKGFLAWIKAHKKELILAGVSFVILIGVILGLKNKDTLAAMWKSLADSIKKAPVPVSTSLPLDEVTKPVSDAVSQLKTYTPPTEAFDVSRHVRTMAAGKHHSAAKAAEAAALGIELLPNQTIVRPYTKYAA